MIFTHPPESIFHIATVGLFAIGSGCFLDNRFCTCENSNCPVGLSKRYLEREISASNFLLCIWCFPSSCFSIVNIGAWLFIACFSGLVRDSLVPLFIIVDLFLWSEQPMVFTLALKGFPH